MLLADRCVALLGGMSVRYGRAWPTERKKRHLMATHGHRPGERSIGRVERKLAREGKLERRRVKPGGWLPNGMRTHHGTVIVRILSRQEQRARRRAARKAAGRQPSPSPRPQARPHRPAPGSPAQVPGVEPLVGVELSELLATTVRMLGPPGRAS